MHETTLTCVMWERRPPPAPAPPGAAGERSAGRDVPCPMCDDGDERPHSPQSISIFSTRPVSRLMLSPIATTKCRFYKKYRAENVSLELLLFILAIKYRSIMARKTRITPSRIVRCIDNVRYRQNTLPRVLDFVIKSITANIYAFSPI